MPDISRTRDQHAEALRSRRQFLRAAASLAAAFPLARAQQEPTFSTDVNVVNLLAGVRTKKGEIVRDLTKDDFVLLENGRPQTIRYFSRESDLPLTLGLMVDTSMSQARVMDAERAASFRFLDRVLRENKDQVFILQFDLSSFLRQPLTSSRKALDDALSMVDTPTRKELDAGLGDGTSLYDAVIKASNEIMQQQKNRKALILMTDGVDNTSEATLGDAVEAALRAETLVYSILFSDPGAYPFGGGGGGRSVLLRISQQTGASFFEVSRKQSIDQIFDAIQDELRSQYSLGFVPDRPVTYPEFRKLELLTRQKGLIVQTRERYWAHR
jgi:VWFA-related protein